MTAPTPSARDREAFRTYLRDAKIDSFLNFTTTDYLEAGFLAGAAHGRAEAERDVWTAQQSLQRAADECAATRAELERVKKELGEALTTIEKAHTALANGHDLAPDTYANRVHLAIKHLCGGGVGPFGVHPPRHEWSNTTQDEAPAPPPTPPLSALERAVVEAGLEYRAALKEHVHAGCPSPQSKRLTDAQFQLGKAADALIDRRADPVAEAVGRLLGRLKGEGGKYASVYLAGDALADLRTVLSALEKGRAEK